MRKSETERTDRAVLERGRFFIFILYNPSVKWYHVGMKVVYNLRMDDDLKKSLEEMAREEGRSLNNLIAHLLKCAVVSNGVIKRASVRKEKEDVRETE